MHEQSNGVFALQQTEEWKYVASVQLHSPYSGIGTLPTKHASYHIAQKVSIIAKTTSYGLVVTIKYLGT